MAEYRLDELARISGVSARNIRAYRERGLLDPPRRVGRSAFYDDYHLSQLRTIIQLHRRGFNSAHIAEFFASLRQGADLADILGIQRAVLGPRTEPAVEEVEAAPTGTPLAPDSDEARRLVDYGLAEQVEGIVTLTDPAARQIIERADDPQAYARVLVHIADATEEAIDVLAGGFVRVLDEAVVARFGADHAPQPDEMDELGQVMRDYRELWNSVVAGRLDKALQQQVAAAGSEYAAGVLLSGRREAQAT